MSSSQQQAFLKLKTPCVSLSSVALKFRTRDASVKDVLHALEEVQRTLSELGKSNRLDPRLSEYALFPLVQQVFNETKRLSPRCLEVAIDCVILLVRYGYRQALVPKLGKELLILMSMLAGSGSNSESELPPDDLKSVAFKCISEVIKALSGHDHHNSIFEDQGTKNVVDQLVYLLLEAIVDGQVEEVQLSASEALLNLIKAIESRIFLASLLPRTVSSLTKALRTTTNVRRTKKSIGLNLKVLRVILDRTLADRVAIQPSAPAEKEALGESWLKATSTQIKNALIHIVKLRGDESSLVRRALEELCVMVIEECRESLEDARPVALETLIMLSVEPDGESAKSTCKYMITTNPENAEIARLSLNNWSRSLPRVMQGHDEQAKASAVRRLTASLQVLLDSGSTDASPIDDVINALVAGISSALQDGVSKPSEVLDVTSSPGALMDDHVEKQHFTRFLLDHESQKDTVGELQKLVVVLKESPELSLIRRNAVDRVIHTEGSSRLAAFWLALQLLDDGHSAEVKISDFLTIEDVDDRVYSRLSLLTDLHVNTLSLLGSVHDTRHDDKFLWQMQALAMECTVMYAQTFEAGSYRPELMDSLYPVLSFLGSPNTALKLHAIVALDKLAQTCQYPNTKAMVIDNNDYLVNAVAWKLNTYTLSPEAPQILRMVVRLCGAEIIPYLDDLIQSVFAALDTYHGYPEWVETLVETLRAVVSVSIESPQLAITVGKANVDHQKASVHCSNVNDLIGDLNSRKQRKADFDRSAEEPPVSAPHRPWTDRLDGPSFAEPKTDDVDDDGGDDEHLSPMKSDGDETEKLSKSHNLLLAIAKSAVPHLASPSPTVRHSLLDLLKDVSPLLGKDENSFLPLINTIWPPLVSRLFAAHSHAEDTDYVEETAYNVCAAAETITVLCINAGDFMSSRIDDIFDQLVRLFKSVRSQVGLGSKRMQNGSLADSLGNSHEPAKSLTGTVNLQVAASDESASAHPGSALRSGFQQTTRTSKGQMMKSLVELLVSILNHVNLTLDHGDEITSLLLPLMLFRDGLSDALETYNSDAVWLWNLKENAAKTSSNDSTHVPILRQTLQSAGIELAPA